MKNRSVITSTSVALVLSMLLHGGIVWWLLRDHIHRLASDLVRGLAGDWGTIVVLRDKDVLGEQTGTGTAIAQSQGETEAAGREADLDQPLMSRDDVGQGRIGDAPSPYTGAVGRDSFAAIREQAAREAEQVVSLVPPSPPVVPKVAPRKLNVEPPTSTTPPEEVASAIGPAPPNVAEPVTPREPIHRPSAETPAPAQADPPIASVKPPIAPAEPAPVLAETRVPTEPPSLAAPPSPAAPPETVASAVPVPLPGTGTSAPRNSADPAPAGDSEIDLFSREASVEFRGGRMNVRLGRKYKLTRPQIPLVGVWDGIAMGRASVTLRLVIDGAGNVVRSTVVQSSGSSEIDNPIRLATYNWYFDPGTPEKPLPREFPFTVTVIR